MNVISGLRPAGCVSLLQPSSQDVPPNHPLYFLELTESSAVRSYRSQIHSFSELITPFLFTSPHEASGD